MKARGWLAFLGCLCFASAPALADLSSPFYRVEGERVRGGGRMEIGSALFSLEQGGVDFFEGRTMQGAQFQVESGAEDPRLAHLPRIQSIIPAERAKFLMEEGLSYAVTAEDPDGGPLEYQMRQDGIVKIPFQASNTLSCALAAADRGRHTLKLEARDADGTVAWTREMYVLRKPLK